MGDLVSDISDAKFCFTGEIYGEGINYWRWQQRKTGDKTAFEKRISGSRSIGWNGGNGTVKASVSRSDHCRCYDAKNGWLWIN